MLERVQRQMEFLQSQRPQHILSRYGELPKFKCELVLPTVPERDK